MCASIKKETFEDPIFDIIYSLPALTHSIALATRTPSVNFSQKSKFMPDYGGILETHETKLKNNSLTTGIPFKISPNSYSIDLNIADKISENSCPRPKLNSRSTIDCLEIIENQDLLRSNKFCIIGAYQNQLHYDIVEKDLDIGYNSQECLREKYNEDIVGIKLSNENFLQVKFAQNFKAYKVNLSFGDDDIANIVNQSVAFSITEKPGLLIGDTCINRFNRSIIALASDQRTSGEIKLYDLSKDGNRQSAFQTINWNYEVASVQEPEDEIGKKQLRSRCIRTFVPIKPAIRGIQQMDMIPSHLVNMLLTTGYRICLVDPRIDEIAMDYAVKKEILSFYPMEYMRRTLFSQRNDYQFYSITNIHLRVFDTRYPGSPMNQVNHMLDSDDYDILHSRLINHDNGNLETVCCSTNNRLSFSTFDQATRGNLVNPASVHLPYHESEQYRSILTQVGGLSGLAVKSIKLGERKHYSDAAFSVLQLDDDGKLFVREYSRPDNELADEAAFYEPKSKAEQILTVTREWFKEGVHSDSINSQSTDLIERDILDSTQEETYKTLDILETSELINVEEQFESKRALERFGVMQTKLDKI